MQLTAGSMTVEFRPHAILSEKFVYTLSLKNKWGEVNAMSMRLMTKREMIETINSRLDLHYQVTDFLTEPQNYSPASC
tara:strand:+ start:477 stop:710 length:234 start_codon:yes stop_codon:yes gene_type:complete